MRGRIRLILKFLLLVLVVAVATLLWKSLPIISGYSAKVLCSGVFVAGRQPGFVEWEDLANFPMNLASCTTDEKDSSVTATVWGLAKRKAIYRQGLGVTLVSGISEEELRGQRMARVTPKEADMDTLAWPMGDKEADGGERNREPEKLNAAVALAFANGDSSTVTRAVVVVHHGKIIAERYAPKIYRDTRLAGWSMTKGVTNALIGILVGKGKLAIHSPAPVEEFRNDDRRRITLANLLNMNSGLSWWELYSGPADATNMLFKEADMGAFAAHGSLRHTPGKVFNYSSGTANILSSVIRRSLGDSGYYRWPYEQLFYRIGMYSAVLEVDAGGTFVGSSYCYATARDWARFGLLYLWDGVWQGQRILPEGWVKYTRTGTSYSALWWLNGDGQRYPGAPADCFSCEGYEGQYIWVIPSKDLVVVRLAIEHGEKLKGGEFLRAVIGALPE